ncbi:flagellar biosynthetic protein FliR [Desulfurobacterium indicum]|uniref:Flagellar biosynthetic protein FliR n=1 Tax=Desulfurobacterium indicum TaxID=1914305 RepID=A0A1R1MLJ5_9BACT|nr:flagellar biosynthetic protein FliR [Desulfurobacterium indicum]OMH40685.1 flagellar biosynthetic protein FliR [Desulfurobacterium indicum]
MNSIVTPSQIGGFFAVLSRLGAFFMAFPFVNTSMIPANVRVLLLVSLSFFVSLLVNVQVPIEHYALIDMATMVLKEVFIGLSFALLAAIFLGIVSYAAELISYSMGLTVANMFDPTFGVVSVLDRLYILIFYLVFFITGSYRLLIGAAVASFRVIPVGKTVSFNIDGIFQFFILKASLLFSLAFKLAFPIMLTLFVTNLALALINRLIPQINVFIVGLPLQIFVGLFALIVGFSAIVYAINSLVDMLVSNLFTLIKLFGG